MFRLSGIQFLRSDDLYRLEEVGESFRVTLIRDMYPSERCDKLDHGRGVQEMDPSWDLVLGSCKSSANCCGMMVTELTTFT